MFGKRFTAEEALNCGIIDVVARPETLMQSAVSLVKRSLGRQPYDRDTMLAFKKDLYSTLVEMASSKPTIISKL